jgi:flagellar biogenesis protein FliO
VIRKLLQRLQFFRNLRRPKVMRVAGVQPLAAGVTVYAIDVDGRRIIVGASSNALCVLDRYPLNIASSSLSEGADVVRA